MEEEAGTHPAAGRLPGPGGSHVRQERDADTVHHIYPAEEYPEYEWMDWNLISVSRATHNRLENRKTGELTKEGRMLQRLIRPMEDWRKGHG